MLGRWRGDGAPGGGAVVTTRTRSGPGVAASATAVDDGVRVTQVLVCSAADDPAFLRRVRERAAEGPVSFHLVVPATPVGGHEALARSEHLTAWPGEDLAFVVARRRLARALRSLGDLDVVGEVGDPDPYAALDQLLRSAAVVDEVVLWSDHVTRWGMGALVRRVRRTHAVPVHVVAADPAAFSDRGSRVRVVRGRQPALPRGPRWRS